MRGTVAKRLRKTGKTLWDMTRYTWNVSLRSIVKGLKREYLTK